MKIGDLVSIEITSMFHEHHPPVIGTIVGMPTPEEQRVRLKDGAILVQVANEGRPRHIKDPKRITVLADNGGSPLEEINKLWEKHRADKAEGFRKAEERAAAEAKARAEGKQPSSNSAEPQCQ